MRQGEASVSPVLFGEGLGEVGYAVIRLAGDAGIRVNANGAFPDGGALLQMSEVSIPNGIIPDAYPVELYGASEQLLGNTDAPLLIDPVTVSPTGSDGNRGTQDSPLRQFETARALAQSGDTVLLLAGTHLIEGGCCVASLTLTPGVRVTGEGRDLTLVNPTDAGHPNGFVLGEGATLSGLTIRGFPVAVVTESGSVTLRNLLIFGTDAELRSPIEIGGSAAASLEDVHASCSGNSALRVSGTARASVLGGSFRTTAMSSAVETSGESSLEMRGVTVTGRTALSVLSVGAAVQLWDSQLIGDGGHAIEAGSTWVNAYGGTYEGVGAAIALTPVPSIDAGLLLAYSADSGYPSLSFVSDGNGQTTDACLWLQSDARAEVTVGTRCNGTVINDCANPPATTGMGTCELVVDGGAP